MPMSVEGVIPWGRSFDEYQQIFSLTEADLAGEIIGCGDGPAAFNAEASARGHRVVSCDPLYGLTPGEIEGRVAACRSGIVAQLWANVDDFVWGHFRDPDHLAECRIAAMRAFLDDFLLGKGEGRYVEASLPHLPFPSGRFTLALVSHLLFLYSAHFDLAFHVASLEELLRVAKEVRVFPLVDIRGGRSPHADTVIDRLRRAGHEVDEVEVGYEFFRGGSRMLRGRRAGLA